MRVLGLISLLAITGVRSSETSDLRDLIEVVAEQSALLASMTDELAADLSQLQQQHDTLAAATATQREKELAWRRGIAEELDAFSNRRRESSTASQRRRGLSAGTCADPDVPALLVKGVCSCTDGLLVKGRNVTKELSALFAAATTSTLTSTLTQSSFSWTLAPRCLLVR